MECVKFIVNKSVGRAEKAKSWLSHFGILSTWNWSIVPWEDAWKKTTTTWDGIELCLDSTFKLSTIPLPLLQTYSFQVVHTALLTNAATFLTLYSTVCCSFVFSLDQQLEHWLLWGNILWKQINIWLIIYIRPVQSLAQTILRCPVYHLCSVSKGRRSKSSLSM